MTDLDLSRAVWRKSGYSGGATNCVEVAGSLPPIVAVRDSKNPAAPALTFACGAWDAFTARVKSGKYDSELRAPPEGTVVPVPSAPVPWRREDTEDTAAMQPDDFPEIDTQTVSIARAYDYMLGGTDNYEIDRRAADTVEDMMPGTYALARNNRRYLERVVRYLAGECGIRQFIDHGSGLPTQNNVHQVAQEAGSGSKVVYVEIDPVVLAHGRVKALLAEDDSTAFIEADASDTGRVLSHPDTRRLINFDEPVAALYISFLHCIPDARDPRGVVRQMMDRLAPGSYIAISHITSDDAQVRENVTRFNLEATGGHWGRVRSREEVGDFFDGLATVPPGLVKAVEWHPDGREEAQSEECFEYGGVARKP